MTNRTATCGPAAWPASPYRGLNHYGPDDAPLFAGRDRDAEACARALAAPSTRVVLLNGISGCGKSSLIRAALIPLLESEAGGFQFLYGDEGRQTQPLFIRSTDAPVPAIAGAIYEFASAGAEVVTLRHHRAIDFRAALLDCQTADDFRAVAGANHQQLFESLRQLGACLPRTLVLIIDQGEEVLTLAPGTDGDAAREEFFQLVAALSRADLDIKLLVALRTEYYGRFRHELQTRLADVTHVTDYYLGDLEAAGLFQAITRPTSRESLGALGSPFDHYGFEFEAGLPAKIVADLVAATPTGGVLPALQIVCSRLYEQAIRAVLPGGVTYITAAGYAALGGIEGQINSWINTEIENACRGITLSKKRARAESRAWKYALSSLARPQPDGTVTTEMKLADDVAREARDAGCTIALEPMMEILCAEGHQLCRRIEVARRIAPGTALYPGASSEKATCYTLAHDALGPTLVRWREAYEALVRSLKRTRWAAVVFGAIGLFCIVAAGFVALSKYGFGQASQLLLSYGANFAMIATAILIAQRSPEHRLKAITSMEQVFTIVRNTPFLLKAVLFLPSLHRKSFDAVVGTLRKERESLERFLDP